MAKSLSERIAARTAQKKPTHGAQNRAAFLAVRVDVKQALDDGWPVKFIWETLHEEQKVKFSYQAFRGYVNRLVLSPAPTATSSPTSEVAAKTATPTPVTKRTKRREGFVFNPVPNPEELL